MSHITHGSSNISHTRVTYVTSGKGRMCAPVDQWTRGPVTGVVWCGGAGRRCLCVTRSGVLGHHPQRVDCPRRVLDAVSEPRGDPVAAVRTSSGRGIWLFTRLRVVSLSERGLPHSRPGPQRPWYEGPGSGGMGVPVGTSRSTHVAGLLRRAFSARGGVRGVRCSHTSGWG